MHYTNESQFCLDTSAKDLNVLFILFLSMAGLEMLFLSGPFLRNFRLEGIIVCCWFYFPSNLYEICDITFKISNLLKRIRYLI